MVVKYLLTKVWTWHGTREKEKKKKDRENKCVQGTLHNTHTFMVENVHVQCTGKCTGKCTCISHHIHSVYSNFDMMSVSVGVWEYIFGKEYKYNLN